jgi:hypothetical protein
MIYEMFWPALCVAMVSFWIIWRKLSPPVAVFVVIVKFTLPVIYFTGFYDGSWTFLDDVTYQEDGQTLLIEGYNPATIFFQPDGILRLVALSGGHHILYHWWNMLSQYLFGMHYYAPVLLNIGVTFVAGSLLFRIVQEAGFSRRYAQSFLVFFLLHWDVLSWSSIVNLKDIPLMYLLILGIYLIIKLNQQITLSRLLCFNWLLFVLWWLRFYVAGLLIVSGLVWWLLQLSHRGTLRPRRLVSAVILLSFFLTALFWLGIDTVSATIAGAFELVVLTNVPKGLAHFWLTPQPWSLEPNYTFLLIASIMHWFLLLPSLMAGVLLWRRSDVTSLITIVLVLYVALYAMSPEIEGPRHRVQIAFVLIWMQFDFLWTLVTGVLHRQAVFPASRLTAQTV